MPPVSGGIAGLLHGPQHQVGQDPFFGPAQDLIHQLLVVARGHLDVQAAQLAQVPAPVSGPPPLLTGTRSLTRGTAAVLPPEGAPS